VDANDLFRITERGLYCAAGDFYVDPWQPVERAVITHAHADHARPGSKSYLTARDGEAVLRLRMGPDAVIQTVGYGDRLALNRTQVSLHPAGHVLGSAQIRVEHAGEVWVISGDYKVASECTCAAFEPVRCHTFITESTFGLPVYCWRPQREIVDEIHAWWQANQREGRASLLYGYALGKAQRVLGALDASIGPLLTHGAVEAVNAAYRASGIALPPTTYVTGIKDDSWRRALVVAPPSAHGTPWSRKFAPSSSGFLSGWMQIRGTRRRRAVDRGFVLSDHADWPGLLDAVKASGAGRVWVTHGYSAVLARHLSERGLDARVVPTRFEGELDTGGAELAQEGA
jgi:putative mRNA 3-end processing factor